MIYRNVWNEFWKHFSKNDVELQIENDGILLFIFMKKKRDKNRGDFFPLPDLERKSGHEEGDRFSKGS